MKIQGSDVYFYCEVCEATVLELNMKLKKLALELRHRYMDLGIESRPEIRIWIRSDGGDLHAGLSAMDCIRSLYNVAKIRTMADGVCASAATFILLGGWTRHMTENSYVMIHQLNRTGPGESSRISRTRWKISNNLCSDLRIFICAKLRSLSGT